jgi:hypothetical protein
LSQPQTSSSAKKPVVTEKMPEKSLDTVSKQKPIESVVVIEEKSQALQVIEVDTLKSSSSSDNSSKSLIELKKQVAQKKKIIEEQKEVKKDTPKFTAEMIEETEKEMI